MLLYQNERFLLIKSYGCGFWSDMDDVQSKLLLAEITYRQPIVFWGENSLYSVGNNCNSFEQYFLPCSHYSINDVVNDKLTYYPFTWNASNILKEDTTKFKRIYRDIQSFINSDADVLVSDVHNHMFEIVPWLKKNHEVYGLNEDVQLYCNNPMFPSTRNELHELTAKIIDVNRYIIKKYIKLRSEISDEINQFYNTHMKTGPILAVHVRFDSEKCRDVPAMKEINQKYFYEIDN
jgi:hypothetical protein